MRLEKRANIRYGKLSPTERLEQIERFQTFLSTAEKHDISIVFKKGYASALVEGYDNRSPHRESPC